MICAHLVHGPIAIGVLRNMTGTAKRYDYDMGIEVQNNEVAIFVQWYEKMDVNSDECKYRANGTLPPSVQNNQLLLHTHTGFKMQQLLGDSSPVQEVGQDLTDSKQQRTTAAASSSLGEYAYARPRRNNQSSYETWHDKEYGILWEMAVSGIVTLHLVGAGYDAYNFFILHFCT